jgi:hypothetical protein
MVAYSFQQRFAGAIRDGRKTQTIRALGKKRHAREGEMIQLYMGMRSSRYQKIRPDVRCLSVQNIEMGFNHHGDIGWIIVGELTAANVVVDLNAFAKADGFEDVADMSAFWRATHGPLNDAPFNGVLIRWERV